MFKDVVLGQFVGKVARKREPVVAAFLDFEWQTQK